MRRDRAGTSKLREAIDAYRDLFDQRALKLLTQLVGSDAAEVFERLTLKDRSDYDYVCISILTACIEAEQLTRTFPQQIRKAKGTLARMEQLDNAVAELRNFLAELAKQNEFVHSLISTIKRDHVEAMMHGLNLIAGRIEAKRCAATEVMPLLGATRKTQSKEAAANAAIWVIANQVLRTAGKPHLEAVADLAQFILRTGVSLERVRHVVRNRRQRYRETVDAQTRRLTPVFNETMAELNRRRGTSTKPKLPNDC